MCGCAISITSLSDGEVYLLDVGEIHYIQAGTGRTRIFKEKYTTADEVTESVSNLVLAAGGALAPFSVNSVDYAVRKAAVHTVRNVGGKAAITTYLGSSFLTDDDYSTMATLFTDCAANGVTTVITDGATILGDGSAGDAIRAGIITNSNLNDNSISIAKLTDIVANTILGRALTNGPIQQLQFIAGDGIGLAWAASSLTFSSVMDGRTDGAGLLIWKERDGGEHVFYGLAAGTGIGAALVGDDITFTNEGLVDAANVGAGAGEVLRDVSSGIANLKTLAAGSGISLVNGADTITITATGAGGTVTGAANVGTGQGVFKGLSGTDLEFYSLLGAGAIDVTLTGDDVKISDVMAAINGLNRAGNNFLLGGSLTVNTEIDGTSTYNLHLINLTDFYSTGNNLTFNFAQDVEIEGLTGTSIKAGIDSDANGIYIGIDGEYVRIGNSSRNIQISDQYYLVNGAQPSNVLGEKQIMVWTGNGGSFADPTFEDLTALAGVESAANVGGGVELFRDLISGVANFRTLITAGAIQVTQNADTVEISETLAALGGLTRIGNTIRLGGTQDQNVTITGAGFDFSLTGQGVINFIPTTSLTITSPTTTIDSASVSVGADGAGVRISDRYDLEDDAPPSTLGQQSVMVWTGNGASAAPGWANLPTGGGSGLSWYELSIVGGIATAAQAKASNNTITITKPAADTFLFTIPDGVDVDVLQLWIDAANNPGSLAKFRFDFQGNQASGLARIGTSDTNLILPHFIVGNNALPTLNGSITSTYYIRYASTEGVANAEYRITNRSPLEVTIENFNQNNVGGNDETVVKIYF